MKREAIPKIVKETILKRDKNKCVITGFKRDLEIHHIIEVQNGGTNDPNNLITIQTEAHDIIHKPIYIYSDYKNIKNKKEYINKLKLNYAEYKKCNNIINMISFLYKSMRYKRSGINNQTKAELRIWLKYVKWLIRKGYSVDILIYFGCSKVKMDYVILSESNNKVYI
jgi:hypothetical protein